MKKFKDDDYVRIESMGFTWVLPWRTVKKDVESGFATFIEGPVLDRKPSQQEDTRTGQAPTGREHSYGGL
jgi:hypothetical protein